MYNALVEVIGTQTGCGKAHFTFKESVHLETLSLNSTKLISYSIWYLNFMQISRKISLKIQPIWLCSVSGESEFPLGYRLQFLTRNDFCGDQFVGLVTLVNVWTVGESENMGKHPSIYFVWSQIEFVMKSTTQSIHNTCWYEIWATRTDKEHLFGFSCFAVEAKRKGQPVKKDETFVGLEMRVWPGLSEELETFEKAFCKASEHLRPTD